MNIDDFINHEKEKLKRFRNYWKARQISKDAEYFPSTMDYVDWMDQYDVFVSDILDHSEEIDDV